MRFSYQGNIVTSYLIQANSTVSAVQCKGTFGATCSSDGTTLVQPAYRHTAGMGWLFDKGVVQFDWPYRQGAFEHGGSTETLAAQDTFDLSASYKFTDVVTMSAGLYNLFDKSPPLVSTGGVFNTFPDTYDIMGRTVGISLTARISETLPCGSGRSCCRTPAFSFRHGLFHRGDFFMTLPFSMADWLVIGLYILLLVGGAGSSPRAAPVRRASIFWPGAACRPGWRRSRCCRPRNRRRPFWAGRIMAITAISPI
jgi:hypothetical protein